MRVVVSYRSQDSGFGVRLHDDLAKRLGAEQVAGNAGPDAPDVLIVAIGPQWLSASDSSGRRLLDDSADRVRRTLETALATPSTRVLAVVHEAAAMPTVGDLPPSLAPLADVDEISASDRYWDATVQRVVDAIGPARLPWGQRAIAFARRRPRISIGSAIGAVGGVIGILVALQVINKPAEERALTVQGRAGTSVVLARYLHDHAREGVKSRDYGLPADWEGFVYEVQIGLEHPDGDHYSVRSALKDAATDNSAEGVRARYIGARFTPEHANRLHYIWVPCVPNDTQFYAEFELINDDDEVALATGKSSREECRELEEE